VRVPKERDDIYVCDNKLLNLLGDFVCVNECVLWKGICIVHVSCKDDYQYLCKYYYVESRVRPR